MGCGYPAPISMADTDPTLEMMGIRDSPFTPSPSPLLTFGYHAFDYLLTCLTLHLRSAACSPCLWNQCCECGVSTMACTIPTPMLAPMYTNSKAHMYRCTKAQPTRMPAHT